MYIDFNLLFVAMIFCLVQASNELHMAWQRDCVAKGQWLAILHLDVMVFEFILEMLEYNVAGTQGL